MYELSNYHLALAAAGLAIVLAYWLPRFFSVREPAASALLGFLVKDDVDRTHEGSELLQTNK